MNTLPVFICEDDLIQLENLNRVIKNYIMINDMHISLCVSSANPYDIIAYFDKNDINNGIYFLDIDLGTSINGIELAQIIREKDPLGKIIFITTHDEFAPLTLKKKIEPLGYIMKDKDDINNQVIQCIDISYERYINILGSKKKKFTFTIASRVFNIDLDTVIFIEPSVVAHKLVLYTQSNQYEFYGKLNEYENKYSELFRCHKAYLINPEKIRSIDFKKREIYFEQELTCVFSATKRKQVALLLDRED